MVLPTKEIKAERYYGLDAVRGIALLVGIVFHGVESFVSYLPPMVWAVRDSQSSVGLDAFFFVAHVYRMQSFFVVAGFFARMLYKRLGVMKFVERRLLRIALPLIIFWPIIYGLIVITWTWGHNSMSPAQHVNIGSVLAGLFTRTEWLVAGFPWGHLWFLYVLLWVYAVTVILIPLLSFLDPAMRFRMFVRKSFGIIMRFRPGSLILALPTIPLMWMMKNGFGVDTPDHGLIPHLPSLIIYIYYFFIGWLLHAQPVHLSAIKHALSSNITVAIITTGITLFMFLSIVYDASVVAGMGISYSSLLMIYNSLYAVASMSGMFAFLGIMLRYFESPNRTIRFLADASYWMYIIHLPVVVFFQIVVSALSWHWSLKVALIMIPSLLLLLGSYAYLVKNTFIGRLLNGKKAA